MLFINTVPTIKKKHQLETVGYDHLMFDIFYVIIEKLRIVSLMKADCRNSIFFISCFNLMCGECIDCPIDNKKSYLSNKHYSMTGFHLNCNIS